MPHKIKIITLFIMISENNIPKRFIWDDYLWKLRKNDKKGLIEYYAEGRREDFIVYVNDLSMLNDEVELLDDTI